MKFLGWTLVLFVIFCVFSFFMDWTEVSKQKVAQGQTAFSIQVNHGKVVNDVNGAVQTVKGWFKNQ